jgi:hypothetical protein
VHDSRDEIRDTSTKVVRRQVIRRKLEGMLDWRAVECRAENAGNRPHRCREQRRHQDLRRCIGDNEREHHDPHALRWDVGEQAARNLRQVIDDGNGRDAQRSKHFEHQADLEQSLGRYQAAARQAVHGQSHRDHRHAKKILRVERNIDRAAGRHQ